MGVINSEEKMRREKYIERVWEKRKMWEMKNWNIVLYKKNIREMEKREISIILKSIKISLKIY